MPDPTATEALIAMPLTEIEKAELSAACQAVLTPAGMLLLRRVLFSLDASEQARREAEDIKIEMQSWIDHHNRRADELAATRAALIAELAQGAKLSALGAEVRERASHMEQHGNRLDAEMLRDLLATCASAQRRAEEAEEKLEAQRIGYENWKRATNG